MHNNESQPENEKKDDGCLSKILFDESVFKTMYKVSITRQQKCPC